MASGVQQIYVRTRGHEISLSLPTASTDTIEHLKRAISAKTGLNPAHLRLFSALEELENSSSLASCGLSSTAEVELEVTDVVFIEASEGTYIPLEVKFTETIAQIKEKFAEKVGTPAEGLRLVYAGKELAGTQTLQECRVTSGWTLHLMQPVKPTATVLRTAKKESFQPESTQVPPQLNSPLPCSAVPLPFAKPLPEEDKAVPKPSEDAGDEEPLYEHFTEEMGADLGQLTFLEEDLSQYQAYSTAERLPPGLQPIEGNKLAVEIEAKATVQSLKATIQSRIGDLTLIQAIIFEGRELEDTMTLAHYGIRPENTVYVVIPPNTHLKLLNNRRLRLMTCTSFSKLNTIPSVSPPHPSESLTIHIKPVTGAPLDLTVRGFYTVGSLKDKIAAVNGFPAAQQELYHANKQLSDESRISECGIEQDDWVHLLLKGAGGMTIFVQFCFSSLDSVVRKQLVKSGLAYRKVKPGISFSSRCRNPNCKAFGAYIVVNKGFGDFDIARVSGLLPCPVCESLAEPSTNCRFYKAKWVFQGQRENGEVATRKGRTEGSFYYTYREKSTVQWRYLHVTVSRWDTANRH